MTRKPPGRSRRKLAAMLQRDIPVWHGVPITWTPERIFPATGWYRSSPFADNYRWEASAVFTSDPNTGCIVVGSWVTITECIKAARLELDDSRNERLINPVKL